MVPISFPGGVTPALSNVALMAAFWPAFFFLDSLGLGVTRVKEALALRHFPSVPRLVDEDRERGVFSLKRLLFLVWRNEVVADSMSMGSSVVGPLPLALA